MKPQILLSLAFSTIASIAQPQTIFDVSVWGHGGSTINDGKIDAILADASRLFQEIDAPGDIECALDLRRSGSYDTFPAAWGKVLAASLASLTPNERTVGIFDQITLCGDTTIPAGFTILGCARPGGPVTVIRHTKETIIWAHELGHGQGLSHHNDTRNLMYKEAALDRRSVTQAQCDAFVSGQDTPLVELVDGTPEGSPDQPLGAMLDEVWVEGPPFARILEAPEELVDLSRSAVADRQFDKWANAITILGLRGNVEDFEFFETVLREPVEIAEGEPSAIAEAKVATPLALGYWGVQTGDIRAAELLQQLTDIGAAAEITGLATGERGAGSAVPVVTNAYVGLAIAAAKLDVAREVIAGARSVRGALSEQLQIDGDTFVAGLEALSNAVAERGLVPYLVDPAPQQ
jgi:hypothetical protein